MQITVGTVPLLNIFGNATVVVVSIVSVGAITLARPY
nr:MAG TPA: hypothetical protein [Caudoviricetes sp.]DAY06161.1 MAG TPA: hypothetical protein [Caudoviricetes sp.]DAY29578.1 MAG TPA: hypothetical protein [Caudoviricetes sp.]